MIRSHILQDFSYQTRDALHIEQSIVVDAFPQWLFGYLFNEFYLKAGRPIILKDGEYSYELRNFQMGTHGRHLYNRDWEHDPHIHVEAHPLGPDRDPKISDGSSWSTTLKSGEQLHVLVYMPDDLSQDTGSQDEAEIRQARHQSRSDRRLHEDHIGAAGFALLELVGGQASSGVIEYLKSCLGQQVVKKALDEYCFRLGVHQRFRAAYRVVNDEFRGPKGEDVLVQYLLDGTIIGAFSAEFGNLVEWNDSVKGLHPRQGYQQEQPTPEEDALLRLYSEFLKVAVNKAE